MSVLDPRKFRESYLKHRGEHLDITPILEDPEALATVVGMISGIAESKPIVEMPPEEFMQRYARINRRRRKRPYDLSGITEDPVAINHVAMDIWKKFDIAPQTQREYMENFDDPYAVESLPSLEPTPNQSRAHRIAGIGEEGSHIAVVVAYGMGVMYVPIKDENKLGGDDVLSREYVNKHGKRRVMEVRQSSVGKPNEGNRILIVEDILSSGITALEAIKLLRKAGGNVMGVYAVLVDEGKGGFTRLEDEGISVEYIVKV